LYDIYLSSRRRAQILCGARAEYSSEEERERGIAEFTGSERRQLPSTSPAPTVRWSSKGQLVEEEKRPPGRSPSGRRMTPWAGSD
jgi:hypothetical protein